jgi:carboxylesterase type B
MSIFKPTFCHTNTALSYRDLANATSFRYYYTGNFSQISPRPWEGAYHSSELPMLFGTHDIVRGPSPPFEYAVSHRMQDLWLAFMRDPYNGLQAQGWPAYTHRGKGIEIGFNGTVERLVNLGPFDDLCDSNWVGKPGQVPIDYTGPRGLS